MQVLYERCAGIDVHKDQVTVAVRVPGSGPGGRGVTVRKFGAFYGVLREMTRWLASQGVTHVAMEATGAFTMPVYHALLEPGCLGRRWCATPPMSRTCRAARPARWMPPGWRSCWSAGC